MQFREHENTDGQQFHFPWSYLFDNQYKQECFTSTIINNLQKLPIVPKLWQHLSNINDKNMNKQKNFKSTLE